MGDESAAIVRCYRPGDRDVCSALWAELAEWQRTIYDSPDAGGTEPGREFDAHLERVGPDRLWVAETADGSVVGLAGLVLADGEAELEPLIVSEAHRGVGIGRELTHAAMSAARQAGVHAMSVRPLARNVHAISFFRELGFDVLGHIQMFIDFRPEERQPWIDGETLAGCDFRF
ncbi:MAG: GNAT family N-acetyltransferase [Proteobacteria bacterium]|nr:GNAT family N-acetyltransferase [Pseudomonadota bacterium]